MDWEVASFISMLYDFFVEVFEEQHQDFYSSCIVQTIVNTQVVQNCAVMNIFCCERVGVRLDECANNFGSDIFVPTSNVKGWLMILIQ